MNSITQVKPNFLNFHGVRFTSGSNQKFFITLILNTIRKIKGVGTLFGTFDVQIRKRSDSTFFKMMFYNEHNHRSEWQTIKHGAMFYLLLTLLAIPSGICSQQDQLPVHRPSAADLHAMLDLSPLWGAVDPSIEDSAQINGTEPASSGADSRGKNEQQPADDPPFHSFVLQAAKDYDVDPALIRAIIMAESSYNPRAVSHRGAQGLMQLMPTTAKWLGVEDVFNPAANIDAGVRYFKRLLDRFNGDVKLALAAYNAGSRYVRKYKGIPPFKATRSYIKKVLKYHQHFSDEMAATQLSASTV